MEREKEMSKPRRVSKPLLSIAAAAVAFGAAGAARAQTFNSGSTGADGALDLSNVPSGTTVNFEPKALKAVLGRDINWDDNRFDFTGISIPRGVEVRLSAKWSNGPVYWLASGDVWIGGTVNLIGENGHDITPSMAFRRVAIPGPGGFPGGIGGVSPTSGRPAGAGAGPSGGEAAPNATHTTCGLGGKYTGNKFAVPLVGGSGGGGANDNSSDTAAGGGGAGGGAILIASSVAITIADFYSRIYAYGGNGGTHWGGGGGGGAIHLVAPTVYASASYLYASGGAGTSCGSDPPYGGTPGQVRIDAFNHAYNFAGIYGNFSRGTPLGTFIPPGAPPAVTVFAITTTAGSQSLPIFLPEYPTGSFDVADATINSGAPVTFEIRARGVPAGTFIDLYVQSLEGQDQVIRSPTPLATFNDPTQRFTTSTTVQVTLPSGLSRGYVRAKW